MTHNRHACILEKLKLVGRDSEAHGITVHLKRVAVASLGKYCAVKGTDERPACIVHHRLDTPVVLTFHSGETLVYVVGDGDRSVGSHVCEFLGKDTTKVQFNYFTDGKGNHEFLYDLGFDASEEFHTYGFDWQADSITWYVDGEAVYTATENIPSTPGKIMMNVWPGTGVDGWLNAFDGTVPLTAEYKSVDFTAAEEG